MIDQHVHISISHDGKSSIEDYLISAFLTGVSEIMFIEHYDILILL